MARRRERFDHFIGKRWGVIVNDGNGDQWLQHFPTAPIGAITRYHRDMTPEIAQDIIRALEITIEQCRERLPQKGAGEVVPFPKK